MFSPALRWFALLLLVPVFVGCGSGEEEPYRKPVIPVTGLITVDGAPPSSALVVSCHPAGGMDAEHPSISSSRTGDLGAFGMSTYETGDGLPEGEYVLTFTWKKYNPISRSFGGPDKLKGRYKDSATSEHKLSVKGPDPIDMGTIELTTK